MATDRSTPDTVGDDNVPAISEFLRSRNVSESAILKIENDKIDHETVCSVDDVTLSSYLEKLGDRVALKNFCSKRENKSKSTKRAHLFEMLKSKLTSSTEVDEKRDTPKKKKRKDTRKVEFGWIHNNKQVRKRQGGGTRRVDVHRTAMLQDLLVSAKSLFFPKGVSKKGPLNLFNFKLLDFKETELPNDVTVHECYELFESGIVTFYLHTNDVEESSEVTEQERPLSTSATEPPSTSTKSSSSSTTTNRPLSFTSKTASPLSITSKPLSPALLQIPPSATTTSIWITNTPPTVEQTGIDTLQQAVCESGFDSDDFTLPDLEDNEIIFNFNTLASNSSLDTSSPKQYREIIIHRGTMGFRELLSAFKDPEILQYKDLQITRILPSGQRELAADAGGVMKDTFTEFWSDFVDVCAVGRQVKVPSLRHDFGAEEWKAIGRILHFGFVRLGYWPLKLSKVFLQTCLFPDEKVSSDSLLEDFFSYISEPDRDVFIKTKSNFQDVDFDDLTESLDAHECRTLVTADNFSSVIIEIAHKELIQAPMYICDCWRDVMKGTYITFSKLNDIYKSMTPTNKSVVEKLVFPEHLDSKGNDVCRYLKRYVKELDNSALRLFLRYCTGSDMLNMDSIHVEMSPMPHFQRRPISHTCGCLLQLADQYDNFIEFRKEFDGVLHSQIWVMDFV